MLRRGRGRRLDPRIDTEDAYAKYQELGSLEKAAEIIGCSPQTLGNRFKALGLPLNKQGRQAIANPVPNRIRQQKHRDKKKQGKTTELSELLLREEAKESNEK